MPMDSYQRNRFSHLSPTIRQQLASIEPSIAGELKYYPCAARLSNGESLACVYVVCDEPYLKMWGVYPENDRGKNWVRVENLVEVVDSPYRLPANFATELYQHGESGMGYTIFTVVFSDGSRQAYVTGNAVDFIRYPEGKGPGDIAKVLPHEGRNAERMNAPQYYWCLYSQ
jgi:hypothetical protein